MLTISDELKQNNGMEYDPNLAPSKSISEKRLTPSNSSSRPLHSATGAEHVSDNEQNSKSDFEKWKEYALNILRKTTCYHLMPESGKVVVFDASLPVKHAFRALAENDIKCAPVWHSTINKGEGDFIGLMTVTDFTDILHFYYARDLSSFDRRLSDLETSTVGRWCTFRKKHNKKDANFISRPFVFVAPDESLFNAIYRMHQYFIHRMPVKHEKSILSILNHHTVLRYVFLQSHINQSLSTLDIRVSDLNLKPEQFPMITYEDKVSKGIAILSTNKKATAVPICEKDSGIVLDAFMRSDIRFFARNQQYMNLNITVKEFLTKFRPTKDYIPKCMECDNLLNVLWSMMSKRCHVAMILDVKKKFVNILNYYTVFDRIIADQHIEISEQNLRHAELQREDIDDDIATDDLLNDEDDMTEHFTSQD
mmetsp:Transcript_13878/g.20924  ORF Transcript_13878/g.20924 Transcript_13878/m.20924 type:complete len:423 (-) Transcript_13878:106-1374(-)